MQNATMRPTKSRRLVSVWTVMSDPEALIECVKPFADLFDQVVLMCGTPDAPDRYEPDALRRITSELHAMDISVLNDYAGHWDGMCDRMFADADGVKTTVVRMLAACEASSADGIDIDFERWPPESRFVYEDVLSRLSEALHNQGRMLSICAFPTNPAQRREHGTGFIDPSAVAPLVDHYRTMVYDQFCPPSQFVGPTSTAPWGRENMQTLQTMVPRHKLVMGLPTYSVDWNMNEPTKSRQVNDAAFIADKEKLSPIGRGWVFFWDVGLIRYTDENGHAHLLYVTDARSTRSQLETVSGLDLAGVCFWVLNGAEDKRIYETVRECFRR